jgi:hypothetical protein
MGKLSCDEMKSKMYKALSKVNDRAFSLITIFSMSVTVTILDILFNMTNSLNNVCFAFAALLVLVVSTILSGIAKQFRVLSAGLCIFLWLFVAQLSGVLYGGVFIYTAIFYAVLFWSNINLLGVLITTKNKEADNARK